MTGAGADSEEKPHEQGRAQEQGVGKLCDETGSEGAQRCFCSEGAPGARCMLLEERLWVRKGAPECQAYLLCKLPQLQSGITVAAERVALLADRCIGDQSGDWHRVSAECRRLL